MDKTRYCGELCWGTWMLPAVLHSVHPRSLHKEGSHLVLLLCLWTLNLLLDSLSWLVQIQEVFDVARCCFIVLACHSLKMQQQQQMLSCGQWQVVVQGASLHQIDTMHRHSLLNTSSCLFYSIDGVCAVDYHAYFLKTLIDVLL